MANRFELYPAEQRWWSFSDYAAVLDTVRRLGARRILEFGPGSSTLALVEGGGWSIDTCEDDPRWYDVHQARVGRQFAGVVFVHRYTWGDPLEIPHLAGRRYDMALIDGPRETPRRVAVLEYCLARCASVLIPLEEHNTRPMLRSHVIRIAAAVGATVDTWETGPLSGSFALVHGHSIR